MGIRVLLCDEQPLVRAGLRTILAREPDFEIVGEFADGHSASVSVPALSPTVVIADVAGLTGPGGPATGRLVDCSVSHSVPVVVLAEKNDMDCAVRALRAGARGFLLKDDPPEQLAYGVRVAAAGKALLSPAVTSRFIDELADRPRDRFGQVPDPRALLTPRELEVLRLLATGAPVASIAVKLFVAEVTVRSHIHHILRKLGLDRSFQAVALAYYSGLVNPISTHVEHADSSLNSRGDDFHD
jgi:DNA-binding NarL/FixJ family response regulator